MKSLEVNMNWKWFNDYFDILKEIYKIGYFVIVHQNIEYWDKSQDKCFEYVKKNKLIPGRFSIQGFKDVEEPIYLPPYVRV